MYLLQVVAGEEVDALQAAGQLLFSEQACGYAYGVTKAAVQAVQYQDKVSLLHGWHAFSRLLASGAFGTWHLPNVTQSACCDA